jgi:uncharacterized protein (TIGR02996 family)
MYDVQVCLFRAIVAAPADDAPRLACADWYDEHGDPDRAELVRVQVELADFGRVGRPGLARREQALLAAHGARWRAALPAFPGIRYGFDRGFPLAATNDSLAAATFLAAGHQRWVAGLRVARMGGGAGLLRAPAVRSVRHLDLRGCSVTGANDVGRTLGTSLNLAGLVHLGLRETSTDMVVAENIARNPALAGLRALDLAGSRRVGRADLVSLLAGARPALSDLDLTQVCPRPAVLAAWAAEPGLARLACLRLNHNRLGDAGAVALAGSPHLAGLCRLELRRNGIGPAGAAALADSPYLGALTVLDLRANAIPRAPADRLRARFGSAVRMSRC